MMKRISYWDWLLLCFAAGIMCGTLVINLWKPAGFAGLGSLFLELAGKNGSGDRSELLFLVARQRIGSTAVMLLLSLTAWSGAWFYFLAFYAGLADSVILSVITSQKGLLGLPYYLATLFPHYLFYLVIWMILAAWAAKNGHRVRAGAILGIGVLLMAGIIAEVVLNPVILGLFC